VVILDAVEMVIFDAYHTRPTVQTHCENMRPIGFFMVREVTMRLPSATPDRLRYLEPETFEENCSAADELAKAMVAGKPRPSNPQMALVETLINSLEVNSHPEKRIDH
jgi:hypothetical protein